jgi:hypothetical protein
LPPDRLIPVWFVGLFGVALTIGCGAARNSGISLAVNFQGDVENIAPGRHPKDTAKLYVPRF